MLPGRLVGPARALPRTSWARAAATTPGTGESTLVVSIGSWPADTSRRSAVSGTSGRTGPTGRATRRRRPGRSGNAPVGRLHAVMPAHARRADGSIRRCPCRSQRRLDAATARPVRRSIRRGFARGPRDCASGRRREFSVDEPIANSSMFVLPRSRPRVARAARSPSRRRAGATPRACASRRWSGRRLGHEDVLERERHARERAELLPARPAGADGLRGDERALAVDVQERVDGRPSTAAMRSRCACATSTARPPRSRSARRAPPP